MTVTDVRELFAYNAWANARAFEAVRALSEAQRAQPVASSFPSVGATLAHVVGGEWIWLRRWLGESPGGFPDWVVAPVLSDLRVRLLEIERERDAFVAGLSDRDLAKTIAYRRPGGQSSAEPLAILVRHVVNHSTYHRGQVATQLRQLGFTPPSTDLIVFQRQRIAGRGGG